MKYKLYLLCCLAILPLSNFAEVQKQSNLSQVDDVNLLRELDRLNNLDDQDWNNCESKLKLLCALIKNLHSRCIATKYLNVANTLCANDIKAARLQTGQLQVDNSACFGDVTTNNICANNIVANNICSNGVASFGGGAQVCQKYRATIVFNADTVYPLGTTIEYNTILDDPNNNISFVPDTVYTVPVSGYYIVTLQVDQFGLQTSSALPILGVPIANLQILLNGATFRESYTPFLTFHDEQHTNITALAKFNAGDRISSRYFVYVMSDSGGFTPIAGTITIEGNGTETDKSFFSIHYLSSDCPTVPCTPCSQTPACMPFNIDCSNSACNPCFICD